MARLFGLIGNRADLAGSVLDLEREALLVDKSVLDRDTPVSWGIGFFQAGEFLLRRKPSDDRQGLDLAELAHGIRSDLMIGHVRQATIGAIRTENTHPFRCRDWLFAHTGSVSKWDAVRERLTESIPEFLRRNIRGDTDSEVLFHLVLSFLHDAGRLRDAPASADDLRGALSSTMSLVDQVIREEGGDDEFPINALLSDGEILAAVHRGSADKGERMALRYVHGPQDLAALVGGDAMRKVRLTDPGMLRFSLVASDLGPEQARTAPWTTLPDRAIVVLSRDGEPRVETF